MDTIITAVKRYCESNDLHYRQLGRTTLVVSLAGKNVSFPTILQIDEEARSLLVVSPTPLSVPPVRRDPVTELVLWINNHLQHGTFQIAPESGEIRFRTSISFGATEPHEELIEHVVMSNAVILDHHFPALAGIAFGGMSVKQAIEQLTDSVPSAGQHKPSQRLTKGINKMTTRTFGGRLGSLCDESEN